MFFSCSLYFSLPFLEFPASYRSVWLILAACALIFALSKRSAPEDSFSWFLLSFITDYFHHDDAAHNVFLILAWSPFMLWLFYLFVFVGETILNNVEYHEAISKIWYFRSWETLITVGWKLIKETEAYLSYANTQIEYDVLLKIWKPWFIHYYIQSHLNTCMYTCISFH